MFLIGDAIDVDSDVRQAANAKTRLLGAEEIVGRRREVHDGVVQCADIGDAADLQILGRQVGNRDRHLLKIFGAATGGDDDFLEHAAILAECNGGGIGRLRCRGRRIRGHGERPGRATAAAAGPAGTVAAARTRPPAGTQVRPRAPVQFYGAIHTASLKTPCKSGP